MFTENSDRNLWVSASSIAATPTCGSQRRASLPSLPVGLSVEHRCHTYLWVSHVLILPSPPPHKLDVALVPGAHAAVSMMSAHSVGMHRQRPSARWWRYDTR